MKFEIQKQEQQMPTYQEQRVGRLQEEDSNTEVEDENYITHKPQMQGNEEE